MALSELTTKPPKIGFLGATSPTIWGRFVTVFEARLRDNGWINGHNLYIDYRWALGLKENYKSIAEHFASDGVKVIVTSGTGPAIAVKEAIKNCANPPSVYFAAAGDPNNTGLNPSGHITGELNEQTVLAPERVKKLREVFPHLKELAIIGNLDSLNVRYEKAAVEEAAASYGITTRFLDIKEPWEIVNRIKNIKREGEPEALYVCTDPLLTTYQVAVNTAAIRAGLPTMHAFREYVEAGGLMSYGPNFSQFFCIAADNVDKLLQGTSPADIKIERVKTFELVINLSTAFELGVTIPDPVFDDPRTIKVW